MAHVAADAVNLPRIMTEAEEAERMASPTIRCDNDCGTYVMRASLRRSQREGKAPNSLMALGWYIAGLWNYCPGCAKVMLEDGRLGGGK